MLPFQYAYGGSPYPLSSWVKRATESNFESIVRMRGSAELRLFARNLSRRVLQVPEGRVHLLASDRVGHSGQQNDGSGDGLLRRESEHRS
mmetsp:Transcript_79005/g.118799  ORF Transcript_79005/g.118799 Transcript_79005/m.118799 type:complete len:90 (-) Transcript_79005:2-271(-)